MRTFLAGVTLGALLTIGAPARAGVIEVFTASGTLVNGSVLSGMVNIDITAGNIVASNLTFTLAPIGPYNHIITALSEPTLGLYDFNVLDAANDNFSSGLHGASLMGYGGGAFCSDSDLCNSGSSSSALVVQATGDVFHLQSGVLRPTGVFVPEPASMALLLTGIAGLGVAMRRKAV